MKKILIVPIFLIIAFLAIRSNFGLIEEKKAAELVETEQYRQITGNIGKGENLFYIFKKYDLDITELFKLREASANIYRLRELAPGRHYKITVDDNNRINSFVYWIDDDSILNIIRTDAGFHAEKISIEYEKRVLHIGGTIRNNLVESLEEGKENLMLALQLSDIFAWDIDFTTDLRKDDAFKIVVEGLYLDGEFKKYGDILSAEFLNNGQTYNAYRFEQNGNGDYYDSNGKSLKKAFLKAPLSFRRISSSFSKGRLHPILKIYRPHHGIDYSAPKGTPVSSVGDGTVIFSSYKGQYGKLVIVRHPNGWKTYYGHLSGFGKGIRKGVKVQQGQIIGYVGATGLATGPHLHYEMRVDNKPVNPSSLKIPRGTPVHENQMSKFLEFKNSMDIRLASITPKVFAQSEEQDKRI